MSEKDSVVSELKSAAEWFTMHGSNTNTAIIGICKRSIDLINRQQAEIESDKAKKEICAEVIDRQDKEIERLQNILLRFMDEVAKWENKHGLDVSELSLIPICDERRSIIDHHRAEAIKEFAERLCDGRVSNDPVVIAVKVELKEMAGDEE